MRIAIVDGDSSYREVVIATLESWGHEVIGAATIARLLPSALDRPFDLLVIDVGSEPDEGVGACRLLSATQRTPPVRAVFTSRQLLPDDPGLAAAMMDGRGVLFLSKPYSLLVLGNLAAQMDDSVDAPHVDLSRSGLLAEEPTAPIHRTIAPLGMGEEWDDLPTNVIEPDDLEANEALQRSWQRSDQAKEAVGRGRGLISVGAFAEADRILTGAWRADPTNTALLANLGWARFNNPECEIGGREEVGYQLLLEAEALDPADGDAQHYLARVLELQRQPRAALARARRAARLMPDNPLVQALLQRLQKTCGS